MPPHRHRAGSLKQQNKAHRGVNGHHASKRALKRTQGGKVERVGGGGPGATAGRGHEGGVGALSAGSKLKRVTLRQGANGHLTCALDQTPDASGNQKLRWRFRINHV